MMCSCLQVVFAGFPDTAELSGAAATLPAYFDNPQVQTQLQQDQEHSSSFAGRLANMMEAIMSVQPVVQRFTESASSRLAGGIQASKSVGTSKALVAGGVANGMNSGEEQQDSLLAVGRHKAASLLHEVVRFAAVAAQEAAGTVAAATQQLPGRFQMPGQDINRAPLLLAAAAVVAVAAARLALPRQTPPVPRGHLIVQQGPSSSGTPTAEAAAAAVVVQPLDKAAASKLLKQYQQAKAAALSSGFDTSQLHTVCIGKALHNIQDMSTDWASRGWFRSSNVWKSEIQAIEPLSSTGRRVLVKARVGETANTWGIDGQQGSSWSNEYDVEYEVAVCRDLQWRIQNVQVKGQEPGKLPRLLYKFHH
jgi:hypothetical protein